MRKIILRSTPNEGGLSWSQTQVNTQIELFISIDT